MTLLLLAAAAGYTLMGARNAGWSERWDAENHSAFDQVTAVYALAGGLFWPVCYAWRAVRWALTPPYRVLRRVYLGGYNSYRGGKVLPPPPPPEEVEARAEVEALLEEGSDAS